MTSPAHGDDSWPPRWLAELEQAHTRVHHAATLLGTEISPTVDLTPAARAIERALSALYDAFDERDDRLHAAGRAATELEAARSVLAPEMSIAAIGGAVDAIAHAIAHLGEVQTYFGSRPAALRQPEAADLRASGDVPRLHEVDRPSLTPTIEVDPAVAVEVDTFVEEPRPKTFEELRAAVAAMDEKAKARLQAKAELAAEQESEPDAESPDRPTTDPPPGFAQDVPPALDELGFIHARTREFFEEVVMVGLQRAPLLGDPWRTSLFLERRMLRAIDAIMSMGGPALAHLESLVLDAPLKDPTRVFAIGMILGCVRGRDALAAAERAFFDVEQTEPDCRDQLGAALKLAPHDLLPLTLRTLLADSDPRHRALAIDVLGYRGLATEAELCAAALDASPLVCEAALPHLALARSVTTGDAIDHLLALPDADLRSGWLAMMLAGQSRATSTLRDALAGEQGPYAAVLLGLCGDEHDAAQLLQHATVAPSASFVTAVGWAGDSQAVGALIGLLEHEDEAVGVAAAYALERITGANLIVEEEVLLEDIDVATPPDPDLGEPKKVKLVRLVSDPRDLPPEPSTESIERPTTNPAHWKAWWDEHHERFAAGKRYRRGQPHSPLVVLAELDEARVTLAERRALGWELVVRTGQFVRFDPHDFVSVQETSLQSWASVAERASSAAGTWQRPSPR